MYIRLMQWFGSQILNQIDQLYSFEYNIAHDYKVTLIAIRLHGWIYIWLNFKFFLLKLSMVYIFLNRFDVLTLKIIFKK